MHRKLGGLVVVVGTLGFAGWLLDIGVLRSVLLGFAKMKPHTAAAFVFAGLSLILHPRSIAAGAALIVALIGMVGLCMQAALPYSPDHMSGVTAGNFVLMGSALLLVRTRHIGAAQVLALVAGLLGMLGLLGYFFSAKGLYAVQPFHSLALHTAATHVILALGILLVRAKDGITAVLSRHTLTRRLLIGSVILPLAIGQIGLFGRNAGWYGTAFMMAVETAAEIVCFGALAWISGWLVWRTERAALPLAVAVEYTLDAVITVNLRGRITSWNRAAERLFGYPAGEAIGASMTMLMPGSADEAAGELDRIRRGENVETHECSRRRKDGTLVDVSVTASPIIDPTGAVIGACKIIHDLTTQKKAEERAASMESRLRSLSESSLIGVILAELGGRILDANDAFLTIIGYSREDLASGVLTSSKITPPEYREANEKAVRSIRETGVVAPFEKEYVRKDGSRIPVLVGMSRIDGSADRCAAFVLDLTERKKLELQLRQAQKMEVIGRLAGGVAHDFNNLLTPILGYGTMIRDRHAAGDPVHDEAEEICKAATKGASLTRQLLAFSRKQVILPRTVDLNALLADTSRMLQRLIGEDVRLDLRPAPGLRAVEVDPRQIEQVLMNLAINARDAMPQGGTLTIETANVDAEVSLSVRDTGTGMSAEVMSHLFEPFFTTKEPGKGTGLGLATVHGIVKQSRGTIRVESRPGEGAIFTIHFPAVEKRVEPRGSASPAAVQGGSESILLVEDDDALRRFAATLLRSKGYRVLECRDGEEAVRAAASEVPIDLMVTDMVMPGMNGRQVAEKVRSGRPGIKVVFMSGYHETSVPLEEGDVFLEKPISGATLLQALRGMMNGKS